MLQRLGSGPPAQGFKSFDAFKYAVGRAGDGKAWHHIVEQTPANIANFGAEQLQNTLNMLRLPAGAGSIHARVSGYYSSIDFQTTGSWTMRVRDWLATKSLEFQYDFGTQTIQRFLNEAQVGQ
ncbi:MAG: hypothetical protein HY675_12445 [Chloroflexi bacterium]|nr:hypothetical protein [Chloroflexota bacterium]